MPFADFDILHFETTASFSMLLEQNKNADEESKMRRYSDAKVSFELTFLTTGSAQIVFEGNSTVNGTKEFIAWIEEEIETALPSKINILIDQRNLQSIPMRVQLMMAKWLLQVKSRIANVAVVGGSKNAKILAKGAKMDNIKFFEDIEQAIQWLG